MSLLTRGKVAKKTGVGLETLRFYERVGLIEPPDRTASGYRDYSPTVVDRIRFIQKAKRLGFSLREVRALLQLSSDSAARCLDVRRRAEAKIAEIKTKIQDLERIRECLEGLVEQCRGSQPVQRCSFLEALESDRPTSAEATE